MERERRLEEVLQEMGRVRMTLKKLLLYKLPSVLYKEHVFEITIWSPPSVVSCVLKKISSNCFGG